MDKAFRLERTLDMCSVDFTGHWQPGAVFRAMQDASGAHCAALHLSYEELLAQGLAWVLTRARLCMDAYPMQDEEITVETWPGQTRHTFFPRHYAFLRNGREIGRATGLYVLLDVDSRKIASPDRLNRPVPQYDIPAPLPMPGNLSPLEGEAVAEAYRPQYTDIDRNGHANNTRYVDWFMNRFPCDKHSREEVAELLVHYHYEVKPGETLTLETRSEGSRSVMRGLSGDRVSFAVEGLWRPRRP